MSLKRVMTPRLPKHSKPLRDHPHLRCRSSALPSSLPEPVGGPAQSCPCSHGCCPVLPQRGLPAALPSCRPAALVKVWLPPSRLVVALGSGSWAWDRRRGRAAACGHRCRLARAPRPSRRMPIQEPLISGRILAPRLDFLPLLAAPGDRGARGKPVPPSGLPPPWKGSDSTPACWPAVSVAVISRYACAQCSSSWPSGRPACSHISWARCRIRSSMSPLIAAAPKASIRSCPRPS